MSSQANQRQRLSVLLVDDETDFRENIRDHLTGKGHEVCDAGDGEGALNCMENAKSDVALVDIMMPGMDGITLLKKMKEVDPFLEVIIVTGAGSIETAVEAMQGGAFHYITKPVRLKELELLLQRAAATTRLGRQNRALRDSVGAMRKASAVLAESPAMRDVLRQAEQAAQFDATVLIQGETGSGKEVVAEHLHRHSARCEFPLFILDCGSLSDTLMDSELFGHRKGAFTGATEDKAGMLEVADKGILLLDEIGDIPMPAQTRLLRFLEKGTFRRVGATQEQSVDVRILAATHKDLEDQVEQGKFREDLYHRLFVLRLVVPPLRERPEDIIGLARHFLATLPAGKAGPPLKISEAATSAMLSYRWPGNVRELSHTMERAAFAARLKSTDLIEPNHLRLSDTKTEPEAHLISLKDAEKRHVMTVLEKMDGNRKKAAEVLGVSERHLYRLVRKYRDQAGD